MHQDDFVQFTAILTQLATVFSKKITDELVQAYWTALRDQSLSSIRRLADQHMRYQKFFPKPLELRPKDDKPPLSDQKAIAEFRAMEDRTIINLEEMRQRNPSGWEAHVAQAKGWDCNAIKLHRQFGSKLWYDLEARCWRV